MAKSSSAKTPKALNSQAKSNSETEKLGKGDLIALVTDKTGLPKKQCEEVIGAMLECMVSGLKEGKSIGLPGIGTLSVKPTAARTGVRPGTAEKIQIPAGKKVAFKVASTLKGNI